MTWGLWFLAGGVVGWLTILMHVWTAARVGPNSTRWFVWALLAGAYFRWAIVGALFVWALQYNVTAVLLAFAGLWLMRRLLLFRLNAGLAFEKLLSRGGY